MWLERFMAENCTQPLRNEQGEIILMGVLQITGVAIKCHHMAEVTDDFHCHSELF